MVCDAHSQGSLSWFCLSNGKWGVGRLVYSSSGSVAITVWAPFSSFPRSSCIPSPHLTLELDMRQLLFPLPFWTQALFQFQSLVSETPSSRIPCSPHLRGPPSSPPPTAWLLRADGSSAGYYLSELLLAHMLIKTRCPKSLGTICSVICSL